MKIPGGTESAVMKALSISLRRRKFGVTRWRGRQFRQLWHAPFCLHLFVLTPSLVADAIWIMNIVSKWVISFTTASVLIAAPSVRAEVVIPAEYKTGGVAIWCAAL